MAAVTVPSLNAQKRFTDASREAVLAVQPGSAFNLSLIHI